MAPLQVLSQASIDLQKNFRNSDYLGSLDDGYLTVNAVFKNDNDEKEGKFIRRERSYGSFSRSYFVGDNVKEEDVKAKLDNGVLTLCIKKVDEKEEPKAKYIAIE